ncbi:MAG: Ku protein [Sandaracinaceae bacterium]|nr:Ku protein [Sandaracinaceae bacterium]
MPKTAKRNAPKKPAAKTSTKAKAASKESSSRRYGRGKADAGENAGIRGVWSGSLSFGLVQIPVKAVSAEKSNELSFHQLDKRDNSPIGYQRINKTTGKTVEWKDIVKGYEIEKGEFVVLDKKDFENANVKATQTIDIQDFVKASEIPAIFFERPYYLIPDKRGSKAYAVLREAIAAKGYVAIALLVIHTRQHLCAVMAQGEALVLEILRFQHELKAVEEIHAHLPRATAVTAKERALAEQLIEGMTGKWKPSQYHDSYRDDLLAAIQKKAKTGRVTAVAAPRKERGGAQVVDLMSLLRKSVTDAKKHSHAA